MPLYQSLNPNSKKSVKREINALEKLYQKTNLQTIIIKKKKFENENSSISQEALNANNCQKELNFQIHNLLIIM